MLTCLVVRCKMVMDDAANTMTYSSDGSRKVMQLYGALNVDAEGYITMPVKGKFFSCDTNLRYSYFIVDICDELDEYRE